MADQADDRKVEVIKGFTFKPIGSPAHVDTWEVHYFPEDENGKKAKDLVKLGEICQHNSSPGKWSISKIGRSNYGPDNLKIERYCGKFDSKETAAFSVYVIHQTVAANPLSDKVRQYVDTRARYLREERTHLQGKFYDVQREMAELQAIAKQNGLDYDFGVDTRQEVADLLAFMNKHNDEIYAHFGKEFGRSFRGLVSSIVKLIDPEVALEI